jgi:hypothetical protein
MICHTCVSWGRCRRGCFPDPNDGAWFVRFIFIFSLGTVLVLFVVHTSLDIVR